MKPDIRIREGWRPAPDANRLLSAITVDGCDVHLEAIRVIWDDEVDDAPMRTADPDFQEELDNLMYQNNCGRFETATIPLADIPGDHRPLEVGDYLIVATSYAD